MAGLRRGLGSGFRVRVKAKVSRMHHCVGMSTGVRGIASQ